MSTLVVNSSYAGSVRKTVVGADLAAAYASAREATVADVAYAGYDLLSLFLGVSAWKAATSGFMFNRFFVEFDCSALPAGKIIESVEFAGRCTSPSSVTNWCGPLATAPHLLWTPPSFVLLPGSTGAPHNPIVVADYALSQYTAGRSVAGIYQRDEAAWAEPFSFYLTAAGRALVSGGGTVRFALVTAGDYNAARPTLGTYTGLEGAEIYAVGPDRPSLTITYREPEEKRVFCVPNDCSAGDIFIHDGTRLNRLPAGTTGQRLKMVDGLPKWEDV